MEELTDSVFAKRKESVYAKNGVYHGQTSNYDFSASVLATVLVVSTLLLLGVLYGDRTVGHFDLVRYNLYHQGEKPGRTWNPASCFFYAWIVPCPTGGKEIVPCCWAGQRKIRECAIPDKRWGNV